MRLKLHAAVPDDYDDPLIRAARRTGHEPWNKVCRPFELHFQEVSCAELSKSVFVVEVEAYLSLFVRHFPYTDVLEHQIDDERKKSVSAEL